MASMIPIAKALYLCDDVLIDAQRVKPHVIGVLNSIRPPSFPHVLAKFCVFAQLIGGHGRVECVVRIVNAQNRDVVYESSTQSVHFTDRRQTRYFILKLTDLKIHSPGDYWVELMCNNQFVDDAVFQILS